MNAKELRIGNLVTTPMGVFKIRGLDLNESDFKASCFNPIRLTEEWLVKFGFLKTVDDYSGTENVFRKLISIYSSDGVFSLYRYNDVRVYITHVHQLQNLYFALTGQELEIKE